MKPASLKKKVSSGGVIFRKTDGNPVEVALVSVRDGSAWCLPKGVIDLGETPEMTAVREVREETGLLGNVVDKLGAISYWYYIKGENTKCRKTVHFFLMQYVSGSTSDHDAEVSDAIWLPIEKALEVITYRGDRSILEKAQAKLQEMNLL